MVSDDQLHNNGYKPVMLPQKKDSLSEFVGNSMGNSIIADPVDPPGVGRKESADLEHSLVPQRWHAGAFGESHGGTVRGDGEERVGRTDGVVSHLGLGIL